MVNTAARGVPKPQSPFITLISRRIFGKYDLHLKAKNSSFLDRIVIRAAYAVLGSLSLKAIALFPLNLGV